jgi:hypothetical protein
MVSGKFMVQRQIILLLRRLFISSLLLTLITIQPLVSARAEVILNYFRASSQSDGILIEWETSSELDNSGFYIMRSLKQDQDFTRINIFFLSDSEAGEGVFYSYLDDQVVPNTVYYYKLEAIDLQGARELFGPISVGYQIQTPTPTQVGTITPGLPTANPTITPSPTRGITAQPYITPTPTQTGTIIISVTQPPMPSATITGTISTVPTETPTLEPLPTFEFLFPASTSTRTVTATPTSQIVSTDQSSVSSLPSQPISSRHVFLLGIIILLWLTLVGFMVLWIWKLFQDVPEVEEDSSG